MLRIVSRYRQGALGAGQRLRQFSSGDPVIAPLDRSREDTETRRARLLYQSRKRGILESGLILSKFAQKYLKGMTLEELTEYDQLLDEQDWDIYYWACGAQQAPPQWEQSKVLAKLREIAANKDHEVLRMPDLE